MYKRLLVLLLVGTLLLPTGCRKLTPAEIAARSKDKTVEQVQAPQPEAAQEAPKEEKDTSTWRVSSPQGAWVATDVEFKDSLLVFMAGGKKYYLTPPFVLEEAE